ncbi:MAG TPA: ABC transporter ATP-binding protein [Clostridia bacterium]|nr:ABC transporter ATP-binding protein [Clostridia bacterium]
MCENNLPLLEVNNLSVSFRMYDRVLGQRDLKVIQDLAITVNRGEVLAVVGSSGSGKSLLAHAVLGLLPKNAAVSGTMFYNGTPLCERVQKRLRGNEIALIPQSVTYLDPLMQIGKQARGTYKGPKGVGLQRKVFQRLNLATETERLYPFQLSGGMARRLLFSTAVISDARLIIADEPTPGMHLDQALEALSILRELADAGKGIVLITHDIDLALRFADKIAVFYAGTTLEETPVADFIKGPHGLRHPYSKALWHALPQNDFTPIEGFQPYAGDLPFGCLFAPRCPLKTPECEAENPPMKKLRDGKVRCVHAT